MHINFSHQKFGGYVFYLYLCTQNIYFTTMNQDVFVKYSTPEKYAAAFKSMIEARERWREETCIKERLLNNEA